MTNSQSILDAEKAVREAVETHGKKHPVVADRLEQYARLLRELDLTEQASRFENIAQQIREGECADSAASRKLSTSVQMLIDEMDGTRAADDEDSTPQASVPGSQPSSTPATTGDATATPASNDEQRRRLNLIFLLIFAVLLFILGCALFQNGIFTRL